MKKDLSKKNFFSAAISYIIKIVIGFVFQKVFLAILGTEYLGLNGLFNNIISLLSISELGIGTAIIFYLYEPIKNGDSEQISKLLKLYKKTYLCIMVVMLGLGLLLMPFVPSFVGSSSINSLNIRVFYFLYLIDIILSYSVAYKVSLYSAFQMDYVNNWNLATYYLYMNILQIIFLIYTKSYVIYLIIKIVSRLIYNKIISILYNKKFLKYEIKNVDDIDDKQKKLINTKVKALFLHKISSFLVTGTDNVIISKFLGLSVVGLYSNYYMIINSIQLLFSQMFSSIISGIGCMLVEKDQKKSYEIFENLNFFNFLITSFCAICIYFLIPPFVSLWIGENYLLSNEVLLVLAFVFYSNMMRLTINAFKTAAGIFESDKHIPFIESAVNIIVSIVLVNYIGLVGVFMGTLVSTLVLHFYSYPKYVYAILFKKNSGGYIFEQLKYFMLFILLLIIVGFINYFINVNNNFFLLLFRLLICILVMISFSIILYIKSKKMKYIVKLVTTKL